MTMKPPGPDDVESAQRLADLMQVLALNRPGTARAIERCVRALVIEETRRSITERLLRLDPEALATVDAVVQQLEKNAEGEGPGGC